MYSNNHTYATGERYGAFQASMILKTPENISDTFSELPSIPGIALQSGMLVFSNFNYYDAENKFDIDAGLTVIAPAYLSGDLFEPVQALFSEKDKKPIIADEKSTKRSNLTKETAATQKNKKSTDKLDEKPTKTEEEKAGAIKLKAVIRKNIKESTFEATLPGHVAISLLALPEHRKLLNS